MGYILKAAKIGKFISCENSSPLKFNLARPCAGSWFRILTGNLHLWSWGCFGWENSHREHGCCDFDETYSNGSEYASKHIDTNSNGIRNWPINFRLEKVHKDSLCPQSPTLESWRTGWFLTPQKTSFNSDIYNTVKTQKVLKVRLEVLDDRVILTWNMACGVSIKNILCDQHLLVVFPNI